MDDQYQESQIGEQEASRLSARTLIADVLHVGLPLDMFGGKPPY
jgi:hypothetical protein